MFSSTSAQKILNFFCQHPLESFFSAQVAVRLKLSKGGTSQILRQLVKEGLLRSERKGRMIFYRVDARSPVIKQFKVLQNVALTESIVQKIKSLSERIILFGSSARGEDTQDSDLDVCVVTREKTQVQRLIPQFKARRKIQAIVYTPQEYAGLDVKEPVFSQEIKKGIVLWQRDS